MLKLTFSVQTGKPGSVYDDHLSRICVSTYLKPSPKARGQRLMLFHDVAPGGVYKAAASP